MPKNSSVRKQTVTPRHRRLKSSPRGRSGSFDFAAAVGAILRFWKPILALLALAVIIVGYNKVTASPLFALKRVEIKGAAASVSSEVDRTVKQSVGTTRLLDVDLAALRQKIEALPRVKSAWVMRSLPDTIRVEVAERDPAVLVLRQNGNLVWLDGDGIELGDISTIGTGDGATLPPVAKGFSEGSRTPANVADDKNRIALYRKMQHDFSQGPDAIWDRIEDIDLMFVTDVRARLIKPPVQIILGSEDFQNRAETALKILDAIEKQNLEMLGRFRLKNVQQFVDDPASLAAIDTSRADRLVLIPVRETAAKAAAQDAKQGKTTGKTK
ncbi:MAG TPA: FtsQ-type POTRA domain-containing protein [Blastocatellia bacterium]